MSKRPSWSYRTGIATELLLITSAITILEVAVLYMAPEPGLMKNFCRVSHRVTNSSKKISVIVEVRCVIEKSSSGYYLRSMNSEKDNEEIHVEKMKCCEKHMPDNGAGDVPNVKNFYASCVDIPEDWRREDEDTANLT